MKKKGFVDSKYSLEITMKFLFFFRIRIMKNKPKQFLQIKNEQKFDSDIIYYLILLALEKYSENL